MTAVPSTLPALAMVFLLLGGVAVLTVAPFELGTIRLAGVSLLWWYGLVGVPVVLVAATITLLIRRAPSAPPGPPPGHGEAVKKPSSPA